MPRCQLDLSAGNWLAPSATRLEAPSNSHHHQSLDLTSSHGILVGIDLITSHRDNVATPRRCGQAPCGSGHWLVAPANALFLVAPLTDCTELAESRVKVEAATTLRDNLDVFTSGPSYPVFLKRVMPVFITILNGPCTFQSTSNEQVCEPP